MNYATQLLKIISLFFFFFSTTTVAQQDPQYTNYMYNTSVINPAYAGTRESLSISGVYRSQWVGLDGAPVTSTVTAHTPLRNATMGLGVSFINDEIGPAVENSLSVDFSYHIDLGNLSTLAFGVKTTANLLNIDYTKLSIYDPSDPQLQNNVDNRFSPNIGSGVYWYSDAYYLGLSVPNFLETKHYDDNNNDSSSLAKERMHYYFMGGYVFDLSPSVKVKPAFLTKLVSGSPLQVDATTNFLFYDKLTLGVAYRLDAAFSGLVGFQLSDSFFVGYSYDAETSKLANYNSGSHEIFLRFEIFKKEAIFSPRFF